MSKNQSKIISISAAVIAMFLGIMVIIGWFIHNDFLRMLVAGHVKMKVNVALGFVFSSIVLLLYHFPVKNKIGLRISVILSVIVSLVGLITLLEYVYDFNAGIDELFFKDELPTTAIYYAGRMSPLSALNFLLIGTGLLLLNNERTATYQFFYLSGIAFVSLLMLIGFNFIADIPTFIRLAIHVAIGFIMLPAAIYFAQPMLQKKISFDRKLFTGFTAVIMLIAILSIFSYYFSGKRISTSQLIKHTYSILSEAGQTLSLTKDIESGGRGYIITGDSGYLKYFTIAKNTIFTHIKKLKELTKDNPSQQVRIDYLASIVDKRIGFSLKSIQARNEKGFEAANNLMTTGVGNFLTGEIRKITAEIQQVENNLLIYRQSENYKSIVSFNRAFIVLLVGVFLLLTIIFFSIRNNIAVRKKTEVALTTLNNELEQKVLERTEEINKSEKKYRYLFDNNPMPMWVIDLNTFKFLDVNEMAILQYGYSREEFLSMTTLDIRPDEDKKLFIQSGHLLEMSGTNYDKGIWNHRKKDGTIIQAETIAHKIIFEGTPARVVLSNDVTAKIKAEEKLIKSEKIYKTIASGIPGSLICLFDCDYRYLLIEGDMIEKLGYSKEKLLGNKAEDVLPPEIFTDVQKEFKRVLNGETVTRESTRFGYDIISRFIPLKDENNVVYAIMTVAIDVTKLKNAQRDIAELNLGLEEKIIKRTEQLRRSNEELEAFSYSVSHDLRAPLRAVNGFAKMLEEDYKKVFDKEGNRLLWVIQENAKKMGILIDDLLAFSRLGKKEVSRSLIDMTQLSENIFSEMGKTMSKVNIKINPLYPAMADYSLINLVMTNLISNAIKYSSQREKPIVEIKSEKKNGELIYSISDNGAGFDMQYQHKLFGVFQRLHSEEEFEGTGVGLAIVKRIISKHNGRVWAEGEPGKGATFYFSLQDYQTIKNN